MSTHVRSSMNGCYYEHQTILILLIKTSRKHNSRPSLTKMSDQSYQVFENIISFCLWPLTGEKLAEFGTSMHSHLCSMIENDKDLLKMFFNCSVLQFSIVIFRMLCIRTYSIL